MRGSSVNNLTLSAGGASPLPTRRGIWPSLALLLSGFVATTMLTRFTTSVVEAERQHDFEFNCSEIIAKVQERLTACETILRSGAAFLEHTPDGITRQEWRRFVEDQQIFKRFPGIQGVGFAQLIPRSELDAHLKKIRAEGFPNYEVRPAGEREFYTSIIYLEPFEKRNLRAFGYDMMTESVRREAMERARDRSTAVLTGKVRLVQETEQDVQAGVLMYLPVFRSTKPVETTAERRASLLGWVYSPYRMGDLMQGIMDGRDLDDSKGIHLEIYDGSPQSDDTLLFDSSPQWHASGGKERHANWERTIPFNGRQWTLNFVKIQDSERGFADSRVALVVVAGGATSFLLAGLLFSLHNTRYQAGVLADRLTADLRASEEKFRAIADYSVSWETWFGLDGKILWVNPGVQRITGYTATEVLHMPDFIATIIAPADREAFGAIVRNISGASRKDDTEFRGIRKSGHDFWLSISWQPIYDRGGQPLGLRTSARDITQLKVAEESLHRANWVLEQANSTIIITDRQANIQYVNAEFTQVTGYSREEAIGRNPRFLQSGLTSRATYVAMWHELVHERNWQGEFQNRRKNGETYWETVAITPLRNRDGRVTHYVGIKQDVTERKRLEVALHESKDRLFLAARAGGVGIWDYDVIDDKMVWDDQMFRLYGLKPERFDGSYAGWQQGIHPDDRLRVHDEIQQAVKGGPGFDTQFRVIWPDGSIHEIRAMALVQQDAAQGPLRLIGTNWDITEEKKVAAALRQSESLLQLMFQSSPLGFLVVDNRTDAILHFNHRFCEIWGIEHLEERMRRGEMKNNDIIPHCLPVLADVPAFAASCTGLQDELIRTIVEDEITFTAGRTIRRFSTQIRDDADQYHGRFYIFEDITQQKRLVQETEAMLDRERQVSEMRTRFISVTSHEFRTPMAAALGSAELLQKYQERLTPAKREELFERLGRSLHRMTEMLDEILILNRMDANRVEVSLGSIDLAAFVRNVVDEIRAGDHDAHSFVVTFSGDAARFVSDRNLLHHILSNLLSNAVRYSPAGSAVDVQTVADPTNVRLSVRDQGIGIPPGDHARIFEAFERGSNVGNIKGTGLGLNIVKRMTELLGGSVTLDSPTDGGSRFTLLLPVNPGNPPAGKT